MPLLNPSFEDAGEHPGEAAHWTLVTFVAAERIAGFGPVPHRGWEDFERWFDKKLVFEPQDLALAFFEPLGKGYEDLEQGWGNDPFLTELPSSQVVVGSFGSGDVESFQQGWDNDAYVASWELVAAMAGIFDGEPVEDFDEAWQGNEAFARSWTEVPSATAMFEGGAQDHEGFESWMAAAIRGETSDGAE